MRIILTKKEYEALLSTRETAVTEARAQVQKELEAVKDNFCASLVAQSGIRDAFNFIGGQMAYEAWRNCVREVVRTLNMPK